MHEMIFAGFGGQGVMLIGQLVAYAAMEEGRQVTFVQSYGPEMRGGTANCMVVVSDSPIGSPVIAEPTAVIAMNRPSMERFLPKIQPGGILVYNSSLIDVQPAREDLLCVAVPANAIAEELGQVRVANMVALGALLKLTGAVNSETVLKVLAKTLPKRRQELLPLNEQALRRGEAIPPVPGTKSSA